jgi:hypothetical protein
VFGAGLEQATEPSADVEDRPHPAGISVRHSPGQLDPAGSPDRVQRVRVSVAPSDPGMEWEVLLEVGGSESSPESTGIWWRVVPGSWQPLVSNPQPIATGQDRVRLDVDLRVTADPSGSTDLALDFTARARS